MSRRLIEYLGCFTFDPSVGLYETPPEWAQYREQEAENINYNIIPIDPYERIRDLYELEFAE